MLITGFGAFGSVADNPSTHLARDLDPDATILRVSWREVADFAREVQVGSTPASTILALGVAVGRTEPTYELFAHNVANPRPDVDGQLWPLREIIPGAPSALGATLLTPAELGRLTMRASYTPGGYLCDFILYRLLWELRGTGTRIGFVHVAPFEACSREVQLEALRELVRLVGSEGAEGAESEETNSSSAMKSASESSSPSGHISNGPEMLPSLEPILHSPEITVPSQTP